MASIKPSVPKGTRDFSPAEMAKRNFIFDTIKGVFRKYGYQQIETPTMENLSTLTGKYGDEGDKLIFKIIDSGDYTSKLIKDLIKSVNSTRIDEDFIELFKSIAAELAVSFLNMDDTVFEGRIKQIKSNLFMNFHSDILLAEIKKQEFVESIKEAFVKYLFSRNDSLKKNNVKNRLEHYRSIKNTQYKEDTVKTDFIRAVNSYYRLRTVIKFEKFINKQLSPASITSSISEKALRYDLTVPFARYVVQHQNEITFPFKRFQVQPVWRADRPQKGRYREFYQCDADVVGSASLLNEAEFVMIYDEALSLLGLQDFTIKINNRKILSGIAQVIDKYDSIVDLTVAIDKLDKIGLDGVIRELLERGFTDADIDKLKPVILLEGSNEEKLRKLREALKTSEIGLQGCEELETVFNYLKYTPLKKAVLELDITLARGLNYYTGAIFEVKTNEVAMGSIGGGGRYDDLTGMFGLKGLTGAGISFGADRIYDVLEELNLFPASAEQSTQVLIIAFDTQAEIYALPLLQKLRDSNVSAELYPAGAKVKKQMDYANNKQISYAVLIGSDEMQSGLLAFKNMESGVQEKLSAEDILARLTD
ncbi:histidine--tRNA ligase [Mucilaginibacter gilvus]|uniref:Histidine--tRNA ligase n=2 Tax=Mucilaginibacter gilvus TaxID=2305909 RepID=A0A444MTD4_9SPHI|nr:histidine--tRNA ligase [Mucilaginibacter gilvus]RWY55891.1 histidine--tRNA ligase [Mucilaginibacter gilvus]